MQNHSQQKSLLSRRHFLAATVAASTPIATQAAETERVLFDGTNLSQWSVREGPEEAFYIQDGALVASPLSAYPAWLATNQEFENFDLNLDFFFKGWTDGGIYLHAPEHGPTARCGVKINIFHQQDKTPQVNSMGSIFPLLAPTKANVHKAGEWNQMRIVSDWPRLQVWVNGEQVQDQNLESHPELSRRLRRGAVGITALSYPLRVRNIRIRELPSKQPWTVLFNSAADMPKWFVSETSEKAPVQFTPYGRVLRADGLGHIATKQLYQDFELQLYIRGARQHNGGVLFRSAGKGLHDPRHYEVQLHDVPEAHYPTGSLYHHKRAEYPDIQDEKWFLFQLQARGKECWIRINGKTVLEHNELADLAAGHIELQAHQAGRWMEFKQVQVRAL